jgi:hypothetical protein
MTMSDRETIDKIRDAVISGSDQILSASPSEAWAARERARRKIDQAVQQHGKGGSWIFVVILVAIFTFGCLMFSFFWGSSNNPILTSTQPDTQQMSPIEPKQETDTELIFITCKLVNNRSGYSDVNVRDKPSLYANIIGTFSKDTPVLLDTRIAFREANGFKWASIILEREGSKGWVVTTKLDCPSQ